MQGLGVVVAIMNAKGGVGKSTTTMMLADAFATQHNKRVLVVDADPQGNVSLMLLGDERWEAERKAKHTLADLIRAADAPVSAEQAVSFIVQQASDIRAPRHLHLLPNEIDLAWVERDMRDIGNNTPVVRTAQALRGLKDRYDYILIDCPPSVSFFTECWLQYADFHLIPSKPDLLSRVGIELVWELKARAAVDNRTLADELGVLLTIVRSLRYDQDWEDQIRKDHRLRCFKETVPISIDLQRAALYEKSGRTFSDKYHTQSAMVNRVALEVANRIAERRLVKDI